MESQMILVKAWDRAALLEALKHQGIELLEPAAEKLLETMIDWTEQSAKLSGGVTAAVALPLLALAKPMIQQAIDKIDPNDGDGK